MAFKRAAAEHHAPDRPVYVDLKTAAAWSPRVRADVREVLTRGFTLGTSPALLEAVREMTDVIDQAGRIRELPAREQPANATGPP